MVMKIRLGKDIRCKWSITTNGEAKSLSGRDLTLIIKDSSRRQTQLQFTIVDNTISFVFHGIDQRKVGDYILTLYENKGKEAQSAVDLVPAFTLVEYSTEEDDSVSGDIQFETIDLGTSEISHCGITLDDVWSGDLLQSLTGEEMIPVRIGDNVYKIKSSEIINNVREYIKHEIDEIGDKVNELNKTKIEYI